MIVSVIHITTGINMNHYVYLLSFPNGMKYVGARSTTIDPHLDTMYLGSGRALPVDRTPQCCTKTILKTFPSRIEATNYEEQFIVDNNCVASEDWYNLRRRTYDRHGSKLSEEHIQLMRDRAIGKPRPEYGLKYSGEGRTPAQRAGDIAAGLKTQGTKNPAKGHKGTTNCAFVPWYYITPEGEYVEVHDVTKRDKANDLGFTYRQLTHGFHYTNEHKRSKFPPRKGWTFGNLPRRIDLAED